MSKIVLLRLIMRFKLIKDRGKDISELCDRKKLMEPHEWHPSRESSQESKKAVIRERAASNRDSEEFNF